MVLNVEKKS